MILDDGFFHGDPHPGNFFIEPSGRVGLIDFGIVGTLDDGLRDELGRLLIGVIRKDPNALAGSLIALGATTGPVDRARLRQELAVARSARSRSGLRSARRWTSLAATACVFRATWPCSAR